MKVPKSLFILSPLLFDRRDIFSILIAVFFSFFFAPEIAELKNAEYLYSGAILEERQRHFWCYGGLLLTAKKKKKKLMPAF